KQESELSKLRNESEIREARRKAEEDFKRMQAAEGEKTKAVRQYDALLKEITEVRDTASNERTALERRLREIEESKRSLEEDLEDVRSEREETIRGIERKSKELETRNETLQHTVEELQQDSDRREGLLQQAQQQLSEKENSCGDMEAEILRLKAQTGDADTLAIIKRELSEQVTHIRTLEAANREQSAELKHFKRLHKSVEVVEEEKRSLQRRLDAMEGLENELGEARIQRQRLEDERLAWTAYLQSQADPEGKLEFESPEDLAKALVAEQLRTATLVERVGAVEAESSEKDLTIQGLETEKRNMTSQIEKLKAAGGAAVNSKTQLRLERQRALAIKEAEYLRAQLKTYDTEDNTFQPESVDEAKLKRIQELEDLVEQYRQEVETLHTDLALQEKAVATPEVAPAAEVVRSKRPRDESEDNERLGQLSRKNRKLQDELSALQANTNLLQTELSVAKERIKAADKQSQTRLQHIPTSQLEAARRDVKDAEDKLASEQKRTNRLKKVWANTTNEFRQLVISLLGWDVLFMKDGKTRVTSAFYPSKGDDENSIMFDGERGTMKISGGPQSNFALKISDNTKFWVKERGSIPCLLAALTLEFWDEANGDGTLRVNM
ncbi:putative spindle assembly checkpoint component MAD1, partial [Tricladium varicosporioides]